MDSIWITYLFVKVEADDEEELTRCVVQEIRSIEGIADTRTLIGAEI